MWGNIVGDVADTSRANETLGCIVVEAGVGLINGSVPLEAKLGADTISSVSNAPPYSYALMPGLPDNPVAVANAAAMDGGSGGWAVLYGSDPVTPDRLFLAIDEEQAKDTEGRHTTEQVAYFVGLLPLSEGEAV